MQSIQTYSTDHIILEGKLSVALPDDARIHAHIINSAKVRIGEFDILPPPNLTVIVGESLRPITT